MSRMARVFANFQEFGLVVLIVAVLAMIIIPVPHTLMDVLIAINIGLTVIVMMVVLYMQTPLELSAFPTILLVLALFRIGITISSSRLILLDGDAGKIIAAFGDFVVGGNLVVGIIIFAIITLINFIVITKGSERVAEVTARFSLDAMPGKQMSIDSDLRAGNIDMLEAQRRRGVLGMESKLFGAMDGAMKFVKGDSIASIIDILINMVGGLVIGMLQHNLGFAEALTTYSILTIGDGLVQQVPSLLISLTAGMMITRVNDDDNRENLGMSIIKQMFSKAKVLYSAAIMFLLLSIVPGMPTVVFLSLFVIMIIVAVVLQKKGVGISPGSEKASGAIVEKNKASDSDDDDFVSWKLHALSIQVPPNLKDTPYIDVIRRGLTEARKSALTSLGIETPKVIIEYNSNVEANSYKVNVFEVPIALVKFYPKHIVVLDTGEYELAVLSEDYEVIPNEINFGIHQLGVWVKESAKSVCDEYQLNYITVEQFIQMHLSKALRDCAPEFLGMLEIKAMLDKMTEYQELIKELLRMLPLNKVAELLQRLIEEDISIRNFKLILDSLLEWGQKEREVVVLVEYVRIALGRYLANKYATYQNHVTCFLVDETIEEIIREGIRFNEKGSYLSIDPEHQLNIVNQIQETYEANKKLKITPVIVTQLDVRRYLRAMIKTDLPYVAVLSYQELEKYAILDSLGVISL